MRRKPEKANVSLANFLPEVVQADQIRLPLIVNDTTLREGEQSADVVFSVDEKEEFCEMLAAMGIQQIQLHSNRDTLTIERIQAKGLGIKVDALVTGIAPNWKDQIKMAIDSGADIVSIIYRGSELMLKHNLKQTYAEMRASVAERIAFARDLKAPVVAFGASDATRTEIGELVKTLNVAIREGATMISLPDTVGVIRPQAYRWIISQVRNAISNDVLLCAHCHNDFGLALANTYAALEAGAQVFDVSVNGLGERSGGTAMDEFLIGLWALYGIEVGIKLEELAKLSEWVAKASGIPIPVTKPVIGENAFLQKGDVHVAAARKAQFLFEPFDPEIVGKKRTLRYGVGSGIVTLEEMLKELKLSVSTNELAELKRRLDKEVQVMKHSVSGDQLGAFILQYSQNV